MSAFTELDSSFSPFERALANPRLRRLTSRTVAWARQHGVLQTAAPSRFAPMVTVASVYAALAGPTAAPEEAADLAARFVLLFLSLDDASDAELPDLSDAAPFQIGPHTPALAAWLTALTANRRPSPQLFSSFERGFHDYLRVRRSERADKAARLTIEAHWARRRHTIFTEPFIDQWLISMGIDPSVTSPRFSEARRLATDVVLLSNDLASAERDAPDGDAPEDLNLIDAYRAERGDAKADVIEALIELQRSLAERCRRELDAAVAEAPGPHAAAYEAVVTGLVDGNLEAISLLDFRYRGVDAIVARLARLR